MLFNVSRCLRLERISATNAAARGARFGAAAMCVAAFAQLSAHAATITVGSLADPGTASTCTLRQAIESANTDSVVGACTAGSGADTIVFAASLNLTAATPGVITLAQVGMNEAPLPVSATQNFLLTTQGDLTITGPGSGALTISGDGLSTSAAGKRILRITDNDDTAARTVSISGVSFKYGRNAIGTNIKGGCIDSAESLTLSDVVFEGCEVFGAGGNVAGGALTVGVPAATVTASLPNVSITNVRFLRNRATNSAPTATVFDVAGAAALGDGQQKIGTVTIADSRFMGNSASSEGAMRIQNASSVTMTNTLFLSNSAVGHPIAPNAGQRGAYLIIAVSGKVTISGGGVAGNTAATRRGGAAILTVGASVSSGNAVEITDLSIIGNIAMGTDVGGLDIITDAFDANGNCTYTQLRNVSLTRVYFERNVALASRGGLRITCSADVAIAESDFFYNEVSGLTTSGSGGASAAQLVDVANVTLDKLRIVGNRTYRGTIIAPATQNGGFQVFSIIGPTNAAYASHSVTASRLLVKDNTADENEAGLSFRPNGDGRTYALSDSAIIGNTSKGISALFLNSSGAYTLKNVTISGNSNSTGGGVVFLNAHSSTGTVAANFENVTVARNGPTSNAYGIGAFIPGATGTATPNASVTFKNAILGQFSFGNGYLVTYDPGLAGVTQTMQNSLLETNAPGIPANTCGNNGNVCNVDAKLEGLAQNGGLTPTHALRPGSPALDAGAATTLTTDQRGTGFPRVVGAAVDIGAFESPVLAASLPCKLDMDGDNRVTATKEGLILLRAMLGFSSANAVLNTGVSQSQWDAVRVNLNSNCGTNFAP